MTKGRRRGGNLPAVLFLLCLGLGYALFIEVSAEDPGADVGPTAAAVPARVAELPPPAGFQLPPIETFSETIARPVFSKTRRPPPPGEAPETPQSDPKPVGFRLTGVVITPDGRTALIRQLRTGEIAELVLGQQIEGWLVESILPDRVVLSFGTTRKEVKIEDVVRPATRNRPVRSGTVRPRRQGTTRRQPLPGN